MVRFCFLILFLLSFLSCGPSENLPDYTRFNNLSVPVAYALYHNDPVVGDSARSYINRGVFTLQLEEGDYSLTIEADTEEELELEIFEIVQGNINPTPQVLPMVSLSGSGKETHGVQWQAKGAKEAVLKVALKGGKAFKGPMQVSQYSALGNYGTSFNVNIIATGYLEGLSDSLSLLGFNEELKAEINGFIQPLGLQVNQVFLSYAHEHPFYGELFSAEEEVVSYIEADGLLNLSWSRGGVPQSLPIDALATGQPEDRKNALDVIFVQRFEGEERIIGSSPFYGLSMYDGPNSVIMLARETQTGFGRRASVNSKAVLLSTLTHEIGHFFGLRHTTASSGEYSDPSILEDGIEDTPFTAGCLSSSVGALSTSADLPRGHRHRTKIPPTAFAQANVPPCPDVQNLMFPFSIEAIKQETLTEGQGRIMKKNLPLLKR